MIRLDEIILNIIFVNPMQNAYIFPQNANEIKEKTWKTMMSIFRYKTASTVK